MGRTRSRTRWAEFTPDHPHARGENSVAIRFCGLGTGPSPRTWGEPPVGDHSDQRRRTIPTHVGRTATTRAAKRSPPDHPHARGENTPFRQWRARGPGPSPRTWGERQLNGQVVANRRTIPTHVGRTCNSLAAPLTHPDHPHARGENTGLEKWGLPEGGPSPRTWGEPPPE